MHTDAKITDILFSKLYDELIEEVDAVDNGISAFEGPSKFKVGNTSLYSRVNLLNPSWNDDVQDQDAQFSLAVDLCGQVFMENLSYLYRSWLPALSIVESAIERRFDVHSSGKIILLETVCPWKDHLYALEKEHGTEVLYVIYESNEKW